MISQIFNGVIILLARSLGLSVYHRDDVYCLRAHVPMYVYILYIYIYIYVYVYIVTAYHTWAPNLPQALYGDPCQCKDKVVHTR